MYEDLSEIYQAVLEDEQKRKYLKEIGDWLIEEYFEPYQASWTQEVFGAGHMELIGICNICGKARKLYTCSLCGRLVCANCFDPHNGICRQCAGGRKSKVQDAFYRTPREI